MDADAAAVSADPAELPDNAAAAQALLSALVTEHFVLQSMRSTGTSEATSRASLYLATLSSSLIALGFASSHRSDLQTFLLAVLPIVFLLGAVTFFRLVDLEIQDLRRLQDIERVKDYYRAMPAPAVDYFPPVRWQDPGALIASQSMRAGRLQILSTSAATVAVINSAVLGIGAALLANRLSQAASITVGVLVGLAGMLAALSYQWRRNLVVFGSTKAGRSEGATSTLSPQHTEHP